MSLFDFLYGSDYIIFFIKTTGGENGNYKISRRISVHRSNLIFDGSCGHSSEDSRLENHIFQNEMRIWSQIFFWLLFHIQFTTSEEEERKWIRKEKFPV